jgi:BirA family biotin operon repressor/biotin-[acetyl-CoA-carboxylase] ligase
MRNMISTFSAQRTAALLRRAAQGVAIRVVAETGSTNADLLAALSTLTSPTLLLAEAQSAGRGRAGGVWLSAPGAGLTFSLAWKFRLPLNALMGLSLVIGVVIADLLVRLGVDAKLKWPNDLLKGGNKLCGVLIETAASENKAGDEIWAVIGIGLNVTNPAGMETQIGHPVADLAGLELDREAFMAALLSDLADAMALFESEGFKAFMARWNELHIHSGQAVVILDGNRVIHEGIALGVDQIGRLVLENAGVQTAIMAGEVSLRASRG